MSLRLISLNMKIKFGPIKVIDPNDQKLHWKREGIEQCIITTLAPHWPEVHNEYPRLSVGQLHFYMHADRLGNLYEEKDYQNEV